MQVKIFVYKGKVRDLTRATRKLAQIERSTLSFFIDVFKNDVKKAPSVAAE